LCHSTIFLRLRSCFGLAPFPFSMMHVLCVTLPNSRFPCCCNHFFEAPSLCEIATLMRLVHPEANSSRSESCF
jgi:hypothetical protein